MSDPHGHGNDDDVHPVAKALFGWVELKGMSNIIFYGLAVFSVLLVLAEFLLPEARHEKVEIANSYGFFAVYGFVAFSFVVIMGHPLGKLLRRSENYYGDQDDEDGEGEQ